MTSRSKTARASASTCALAVSLPGVERDVAQAIVDQAHIVCPYSHATRNGLDVRVTLV